MKSLSPLQEHHQQTRSLALQLQGEDVRAWLLRYGYFPEAYVLPPCFSVEQCRTTGLPYFEVKANGKFKPDRTECQTIHFPKGKLTDRTFGIIDPHVHHDIVCALTADWATVVNAMLPEASSVSSFGFPVPIDSRHPGRLGHLRSGRSIYEFLRMAEDEIVTVAYRYSYIVRADIRNFYRSIYTHAISWALHGKSFVRDSGRRHDFSLLGNRLDSLLQNASDGCTNGIPIGPVVSDIAAEILAAAVDVRFTEIAAQRGLEFEAVRFKDDYRILVHAEANALDAIKYLQSALKDYNLELGEEKTAVVALPDGLFRPWVSLYHTAYPRRKKSLSWREFRELYLAVLRIDRQCPGTGVIDRFLADIVSARGELKVQLKAEQLQNMLSMLLMLARLRTKAFPKVLAIVEAITASQMGQRHRGEIVAHLEQYLAELSKDEGRNKYLLTWISYFLVSNGLENELRCPPKFTDPLVCMVFENRNTLFPTRSDFCLFRDSRIARQEMSLLKYLDVFRPPKEQ